MTRYRLDILTGDYGLSNKDITFLCGLLTAKITPSAKQKINHKIEQMTASGRDYGLLQLSPNILVGILKSQNTSTTLNLGYPFPLTVKKTNIKFNGYTVNFYLRGENIRSRQRNYVFKYFPNTVVTKSNDSDAFRTQLKQTYNKYNDSLIYVDLYRFIGDGILGLYFIDSLKQYFNPTQTHIFSSNSRHLPSPDAVHHISELSEFIQGHDYFTIVIPNLLDNQFNEFINIINQLKQKHVLILVPSRNMYIEILNDHKKISWYKTPDILLKNQPIVDYMRLSLSAFMGNEWETEPTICTNNYRNLFIDPFSSLKEKQMPVKECSALCEKLIANGFNVFVSNGLNQDEYTGKLKKYGVEVIKDSGLKDLSYKMQKYDIGCVISTDSSIAHLSAYLHIPTIVLYRSYFWDPNTIQSMTNDSPGGFCRADLPMFPLVDATPDDIVNMLLCINQKQKCDELAAQIKQFYFADNKTVLETHNKLMSMVTVPPAYNPDLLLRGILNKSKNHDTWQIARNIWENFPQYKISGFYR